MRQDKPLVVVTGPRKRLKFGWWATRFILWWVGLRGVYVYPGHKSYPAKAKGLIIGGGDDIEPVHYGLTGDAGAKYDPERDQLEMGMAKLALENGLPILGICRGAQLLNIVLGGGLHTDIRPLRQHTPNRNSVTPVKWANIKDGSRLADILGSVRVKVNSLHNQAVKTVGLGLSAVAKDDDDFIQALEGSSEQFLLGVQWHPEYLPYLSHQRRLFKAFAVAVNNTNAALGSDEVP